MATFYSDQITIARSAAAGNGNQYVDGLGELGAKERIAFFSVLTTGMAQNDVVNLVTLPKNARLLGGKVFTEALGTSVTLSLGTDVDLTTGTNDATTVTAGAANLLAATSVAAASATDFAATYALGAGAKTSAVATVYGTVGGANPTTAKQIQGWIRYAQN